MNFAYATEELRIAARRETWRKAKRMALLRDQGDDSARDTQRKMFALKKQILSAPIDPDDPVIQNLQALLADHQGSPERRKLIVEILEAKQGEFYPGINTRLTKQT